MIIANYFKRLTRTLLLAAGLMVLCAGAASAAGLTCLFITRDHATFWTQVEIDRLTALGFTITEVHDNGAFNGFPQFNPANFTSGMWTQAMLESYDLIYFDYDSSSPNADQAPIANCTKPVVIQKFLGLDSQNHITNADASVHDATVTNSSDITIANLAGNSILAEAGLTPGSTVTYTATGGKTAQSIELNSGATGLCPGAVVLATVPSSSATFPGTASVWTLDTGAATFTGTASGRRAGFGIFASVGPYTAADLTPAGGKLFDAVIHWLVPASVTSDYKVIPTSLNFSVSGLGATSKTLQVVCNASASSVTLTALSLSPSGSPFSLGAVTLPAVIPTGTTKTLQVNFTPTAFGSFATTATLSITDTHGAGTFKVPITAQTTVNGARDWIRFQ